MEIHSWQEEFAANAAMDHQEVIAQLSDIQESQTLIQDKIDNSAAALTRMMILLQTVRSLS